MSDTTNKHFKITVPITRCYLRKAADGTDKYVVEGMASNTNMDLTGERMAESAIEAMSKSLATHAVVFKNEHGNDWDDEFGEVVALTATGDHRLMMEAELDPDHYRTKTLVAALNKGRQLGLSIGGLVVESAMEYAEELKRLVRTYTDILLQEISVTGTPAVADTWLTNINKSIRMDDTKELMPKEDETPTPPTTDPQPPVETDAPTEDQPTPPTPPVTEPAAEPQDDAPTPDGEEAAKSAAAQAETQRRAVAKAAILGSWAESDITDAAIDSLSWNLRYALWQPMVLAEGDTRTPEERIAVIEAALDEYHQLMLAITTALIQNGLGDNAAAVERNVKGENPADLTKSLSDKDTALAEVTKTRDEATANVEELTKSLTGKDEEIATLTKSAADSAAELKTKTTELDTFKARKGLAVGKFEGQVGDNPTEKPDETSKSTMTLWLEDRMALNQPTERTAA